MCECVYMPYSPSIHVHMYNYAVPYQTCMIFIHVGLRAYRGDMRYLRV